jgi:hypothetical protein
MAALKEAEESDRFTRIVMATAEGNRDKNEVWDCGTLLKRKRKERRGIQTVEGSVTNN